MAKELTMETYQTETAVGQGGELALSNREKRYRMERNFRRLCGAMAWSCVLVLVVLIGQVLWDAGSAISWDFLTNYPSRFAAKAGVKSAIFGTIWLIALTALIAIPVGVAAAIYFEEFSAKGRLSRIIEVNLSNLAGVPSVIYGLLGLTFFVRYLELGRSLWAGALTMGLLVLPIIVIASRESIRAVPESIRQGAFALGATKWQAVWSHVLPMSLPGIMTGTILALSRAIGETAPLIMIGAFSYVAFVPEGPHDQFTTLPIQIFNWAARPQKEFHALAAGAIVVLLVGLFLMNLTAIIIRQKSQRTYQ